jgi:hypothetical protein
LTLQGSDISALPFAVTINETNQPPPGANPMTDTIKALIAKTWKNESADLAPGR